MIRDVIYGGVDLNWNMFEHQLEYMAYLNQHHIDTLGKSKVKYKYGKYYVHFYVIIKMFENNNTAITETMLADILTLYNATTECNPLIDWIISKL